jgi:ribosomal protein S6--L-glutamate ligase
MNIISFNPWLSLGMSGIKYLKAESLWNNIDNVKKADLILYPEYWMVNLWYACTKGSFPVSPVIIWP